MITLRDLLVGGTSKKNPIIDAECVECIWDENFIRHHRNFEDFYDYKVTDICPSEWEGKIEIYVEERKIRKYNPNFRKKQLTKSKRQIIIKP